MTNKLKVGDTKRIACYECEAFVNATFKLRDVRVSDNNGIIKNILVCVCDNCDNGVAVPSQTTPAIKAHLYKRQVHAHK